MQPISQMYQISECQLSRTSNNSYPNEVVPAI